MSTTTAAAAPQDGQRVPPLTTPGVSVQDVVLPDGVAPWDPAPTRLPAEDQLEIVGVAARFNWAVDTRHFESIRALLTDDAVLDHQWGFRTGAGAAEELVRSREPDEKAVRHQNTNHVLAAHADGTVTMTSYLLALRVDGSPEQVHAPYVIAHGVNTHLFRKVDGRWRIARLTLDQTSVYSGTLRDAGMRGHDAATAPVRARLDGRAP